MIEDDYIELLLKDLLQFHGYDFTNYSRASLKRRINRLYLIDKFLSFSEFQYRIRYDASYLARFIGEITVNVTEMFRDPSFYRSLRYDVIPLLATKPFVRIWHAGCASGEEVYSMAILLKESGVLEKSLLYATDLNPAVLDSVREGAYPVHQMQQYSENYIASGGEKDFSEYYSLQTGTVKFSREFAGKIITSTHNLVSDSSFNEFDLILCRNVLIYFNKQLQNRALSLFHSSLSSLGYLALGAKETLNFSVEQHDYMQLNSEKIWKKIS